MNRLVYIAVFAAMIAGVFAGIAISQEKAYPVLKAQKFELVDAEGATVATLVAEKGGAQLYLMAKSPSKASALLTVDRDNAGLMLTNKTGKGGAMMHTDGDTSSISVDYPNGQMAAAMVAGKEGHAFFNMYDTEGKTVWRSAEK